MRDRSTILIVACLVLIVGAVAFYALKGVLWDQDVARSDLSQIESDSAAPYTDLDGNPVSLSEFSDTVLVINAWASWSPFSKDELHDLSVIASEYADEAVLIFAINRKESSTTAKVYLKHIDQPQNIQYLLDPEDLFYRTIDGNAMPETVFYDKEGNIVFHKHGTMSVDEMRQRLDEALNTNEQ